ncbi:17634_t:CDS:2, partial [Cetraspora pellucida]
MYPKAEEGITTPYRSGPLPPPSISTNGAVNNGRVLIPHLDLLELLTNHGELEFAITRHTRSGVLSPHDHTPDHSQQIEDAVRAKDDIMNRMGSRVGNCIVPSTYACSLDWNISTSTTPQILQNIFAPFSPIGPAIALTHKNCGFANFEKLDDAVKANKEVLGNAVGPVRIGFSKVQPKQSPTSTPSQDLLQLVIF